MSWAKILGNVVHRSITGSVPVILALVSTSFSDVLVNQCGYDIEESKRFTVPGATETTEFKIRRSSDDQVVYTGSFSNGKGDFSDFKPESAEEYYIEVSDYGQSYPFYVTPYFFHTTTARRSYQFFMDARLGVEGYTTTKDGGPSRDAGAYNRETLFEALLYASNPSLFDQWDHEPNPDHSEFNENGIPDLIDILLWHADFCYKFRESPPPGQSKWDYEHAVEQLVAACAAYHWFLKDKGWMDEETYRKYLDWVLLKWSEYKFDVPDVSFDGMWRKPPGYRIMPNVLMREIADYESDMNGAPYIDNAKIMLEELLDNINNVDDTVCVYCNMDIPFMSILYTYLAFPDHMPDNTLTRIGEYAARESSLADNMWDWRKRGEGTWVVRSHTGDIAAYPTCLTTADKILGNSNLRPLSFSNIDMICGRNSCGLHFSHRATESGADLLGADTDWPCTYGGSGQLKNTRGCMNGAPWNDAFPYSPEVCPDYNGWRKCEGWAVYQRGLLSTLGVLLLDRQSVWISSDGDTSSTEPAMPGQDLHITLRAALNDDFTAIDSGQVTIVGTWDGAWDSETVTVVETGPNTALFQGVIPTAFSEISVAQNGVLEVSENEMINCSYGYSIYRIEDEIAFGEPVGVDRQSASLSSALKITHFVTDGRPAVVVRGNGPIEAKLTLLNTAGRIVSQTREKADGTCILRAENTGKAQGVYPYVLEVRGGKSNLRHYGKLYLGSDGM